MNKIIQSLTVIVFVVAVAIAGTGALFADIETSTGNVFTAGAIDLRVDNESYVTDMSGELVASSSNSWRSTDLTNELFFSFYDLKPGDQGEDTISLIVDNNDSYVCLSINITETPDNDITEPEEDDDLTPNEFSQDGELQDVLYFAFWADDGDNVFEKDEEIFIEGFAGAIFDGENWTLADSEKNIWNVDQTAGPMPGEVTKYIAKDWCFGVMEKVPVDQDGEGKIDQSPNGPLARGTGFSCDGAAVNNASQTDGIKADIDFYAVQSRHNSDFKCSDLNDSVCVPSLEVCDGIDNDCDGEIDEGCPAPPVDDAEICGDGIDNNENGIVDEDCMWINEIHYDNLGADTDEFVEVAGTAGMDLSGWMLILYNGVNGLTYDDVLLDGIIPNEQMGFGTLWFFTPALQNGSPDGIALVSPDGTVMQFLSYEGSFMAMDGPAGGMTSVDIGVFEDGSPADSSLQLHGTGNKYNDFTWTTFSPTSQGFINTEQTFN